MFSILYLAFRHAAFPRLFRAIGFDIHYVLGSKKRQRGRPSSYAMSHQLEVSVFCEATAFYPKLFRRLATKFELTFVASGSFI